MTTKEEKAKEEAHKRALELKEKEIELRDRKEKAKEGAHKREMELKEREEKAKEEAHKREMELKEKDMELKEKEMEEREKERKHELEVAKAKPDTTANPNNPSPDIPKIHSLFCWIPRSTPCSLVTQFSS
ncbi:DNA ligase 1-like isoform X2 [Malaclemys terrapin pileata]|uniref:DNA ligase 1-like isoform X2 n=1 Tax=Malaclemys terrapin pileata TaxID=2991368 RepID=UPI0023A8B21C|nr:DNA ligase 1-like isoform X2 [Malaclemys terrapin pileata]